MGIRFEVYNESDPSLHKLFRKEEDALNCMCDEALKIYHRPVEERMKIKYRKIEVPDMRLICCGCHKEFYQDVDLSRVGEVAVCPHCHGHFNARNCLPDEDRDVRGDYRGTWSIKCPACGCGNCYFSLYEKMPEVSQVFCPRCEDNFSVNRISGIGELSIKLVNGIYFFAGGCPSVKTIETIGEKWTTARDSNLHWCQDAYSESIIENDLAFAAHSHHANCIIDYECYIAPLGIRDRIGGFFSMEGRPKIYYRAIGQFAYIHDIEKQIEGASLLYWCRDAEYRRSAEYRKGIPQTNKCDINYIQYLSWETYSRYQITYGEYKFGSSKNLVERHAVVA